jgi:energy-coupling factor transporter transmembrane protein EcfT
MLKQAQRTVIPLSKPKPFIGSLGHMGIFIWALGMVLIPSPSKGIILALITLGVLTVLYPAALRRLARPRWVVIFGSLFLINVFFGGSNHEATWSVLGVSVSDVALLNGLHMTLRAITILLAADGFSRSVNIIEVAGMLERSGFRGLGFSIGVATNFLPDLRQAGMTAWHSLRMRGGFRAQWWRGIQLLALTVFSNALRHAEQIVLAAEVRAFRPEFSRISPLRIGELDWWLMGGLSIFSLILIFG